MKDKIHPKYVETVVTCGCGEKFTTRSTQPKIVVEICSKCHPFYTGKQKLVDTAGRVEKFQRRYGWGRPKEQAGKAPAAAPAPTPVATAAPKPEPAAPAAKPQA